MARIQANFSLPDVLDELAIKIIGSSQINPQKRRNSNSIVENKSKIHKNENTINKCLIYRGYAVKNSENCC
jgi:hypothetical protein